MMRSRSWRGFCWILLIAAVVVIVVLLFSRLRPGSSAMTGYCCLRATNECIGDSTPVQCEDAGGFAFTQEESVCQVVCSPSFQNHAALPRP